MTDRSKYPVFFDPSSTRWGRVLRIISVLVSIVTILIGTLILEIFLKPDLPSINLGNDQARSHQINQNPSSILRHAKFESARSELEKQLKSTLPPLPQSPKDKFERIAFYVNWDDNSWVSLKNNLDKIDTLIAEWIHLKDSNGNVITDDEEKQSKVIDFINKQRQGMPINALINNFHDGKWDSSMLQDMLGSGESRSRCIDQIESFLYKWKLSGVSIDFEAVPNESQPALALFMQELYSKLHPKGFTISQSVPVDDEHYQFSTLSKSNDYLILMAYDEHASDNEAGPIASQDWFVNSIEKRTKDIDSSKLVIGIGNYGYNWRDGTNTAEEISFQDALALASDSDDEIELEEKSGNPRFKFQNDDGSQHTVWFLDAVTAFNQIFAANRLKPRGYALWRLGSEDPDTWKVLNKPNSIDRKIAEQLETLSFGYDLDYQGKGEILRVTGTPDEGKRNVSFDPDDGMLTDDEIQKYPQGYTIQRWGFNKNHAIALTFDDGPDPQWTPQVLKILKEKNVHATFFIVGENGETNPELIDRIYNEGHDIGNHTYTHPNIADINPKHSELEINATERLIESRTGHRSLLFRPPYAEDVEPETPDQVKPLVLTSGLGYYSVGLQIDPDDWRRPPPEEIIRRVMSQAATGDGNVVLLHDSGGDRSNTIKALPVLIDNLRSAGYRLVTISELIHEISPSIGREDIMPAVKENFSPSLILESYAFIFINILGRTLRAVFFIGILMGVLRFIIVVTLATFRGKSSNADKVKKIVRVSFIVPAFNEEKLISRTIYSLLASEGIEMEIIIVDDGSTDKTSDILRELFSKETRVRLLSQINSGKAEALNYGIREAKEEIIIALDADTLFTTKTAARLVSHFDDQSIGAVAGNAKVGNRMNILTRWQALEYVTSQNLDRRAFEKLNCITVVPGAVGAWRRKAINDAGGFVDDTLAEDADLTMRIVRKGYKIKYEQSAIAYTEAPQTISAFLNQRFRWMYGTLQACWKHRGTLLRRNGGTLGNIALPNVMLFQIAFPLISPIMDFTMIWTGLMATLNYLNHPADGMSSAFWHCLFYYCIFLSLDMITALIAYLFEPEEDWRLLPWLLLQRFFYRQLMYYVAIRSIISALRGPHVGWGRVQRYGSVKPSS